jgi:hypothetical protein
MRFFRYDPRKDEWTNRIAFEQWNTVARQGDRFFVGIYGSGGLLEWNPFAPWVDTSPGKKDSNPRLLTEVTPTIGRPHKLLAHPDGRTLVLAGTPDYGLTGGGLLFWDRLASKQVLLTQQELIPQHSTMSLVALPGGKLLGGTTVDPGTGGQTKAEQAELYLLDLATKRIEWHDAVIPGVRRYADLCLGPDGLVWGFADGTQFVVFDPASKHIVHRESTQKRLGRTVSHQGPRIFVPGPNKAVYVLFDRGIAKVQGKDWRITWVAKSPESISNGGDYVDGRIYFSTVSHLLSFKLPD